jgi:hypothetical protein
MAGFVAWVDYSSAERERMRRAVALFKERDTRDELGLGNIRDALSDLLFPGTSTIQTRPAYALFVPWLYRDLERKGRVRGDNVEARARAAELELIGPLRETERANGVLGSRAGAALQRLPSSVYWNALLRWKVFQQDWSIDEYHRAWDPLRAERGTQRTTDDSGILPDPRRTWHPELPEPPATFPHEASFSLRRQDAVFLQERIRSACAGSLLAYAVDLAPRHRPALDVDTPWHAFHHLPPHLTRHLHTAHQFSALMQGAALVYNVALARLIRSDELTERHLQSLSDWSADAQEARVTEFELRELWDLCATQGANIGRRTQAFVEQWQALLQTEGFRGRGDSRAARSLVEQRETKLKGAMSRFRNARARDVWSGNSGIGRMVYRWPTARVLLEDLYAGLAAEEN